MAAVAAAKRFGVRPRDVKYIVAYPAYVVMLGPYKDVVVPDMRRALWWFGELFPWKSTINSGLQHLPDVPDWKDAPPWRSKKKDDLEDIGTLKQKVPDMKRWTKGVHQIVLWLGESRPSKASLVKKLSRRVPQPWAAVAAN